MLAMSGQDVNFNTKEYVTCVLEPWYGYAQGMEPAWPNVNLQGLCRFWTRDTFSTSTVLNGSTYDVCCYVLPVANTSCFLATAFAAGKASASSTRNDPAYGSFSAFDQIRLVSAGMEIRNTTAVSSQAGISLQGCVDYTDNPGNYTWSNYATNRNFSQRGLGKPGDVGRVIWRPTAVVDESMIAYNATTPGGSGESQLMMFWTQSPAAQTFEVTIYRAWEVLPLPDQDVLYPSKMKLGDPALAARMLAKAFAAQPATSQSRNVQSDDGVIESVVTDVKNIWGGVKSVGNLVGTIGSFIGGLFAKGPNERLARMLHRATQEDIDYLRTLVNVREFKSITTLRSYLEQGMADERAERKNKREPEPRRIPEPPEVTQYLTEEKEPTALTVLRGPPAPQYQPGPNEEWTTLSQSSETAVVKRSGSRPPTNARP